MLNTNESTTEKGSIYKDGGHGKTSTWKGGGVDTAGMTAAWAAAAAAAAAAAVAGSGCTAMGLIMCSIVWILPSSMIFGAGAAWNMEYWAPMAGMATAREAGRRQVCHSAPPSVAEEDPSLAGIPVKIPVHSPAPLHIHPALLALAPHLSGWSFSTDHRARSIPSERPLH